MIVGISIFDLCLVMTMPVDFLTWAGQFNTPVDMESRKGKRMSLRAVGLPGILTTRCRSCLLISVARLLSLKCGRREGMFSSD